MEITRKPPSTGISGYVQNVRDNRVDKSQPDAAHAAKTDGDSVRLSSEAREVQEAMRVMKELPDIRSDKVAELKAKVEQGIYRPDENKIAYKLLQQSIMDDIN